MEMENLTRNGNGAENGKNKPACSTEFYGDLSGAVWLNPTDFGTMENVTLRRTYSKDGELRESKMQLRRKDLKLLKLIISDIEDWFHDQQE